MPGLICRRMLGVVLKLCILLIVKLLFEVYQISKLNWITMLKLYKSNVKKTHYHYESASHDLLSRNCVVSEMRNYSCLPIPAAWMIAALRKRTSWQRINVQIFMEN